jgi:ABC-type polysaccharide/polyol phosphate export permease
MNGPVTARLPYLSRIWQLRYFWFALVVNDLRHRYKRSFLGIGWSLVRPLAMTCLFCIVFGQLFHLELRDYAPHLLIGLTIWQFLTESLNQGCHCFINGSAYIRQQQVPLAIFPLRVVLAATFHLLIALALALFVTLYFKGSLNPLALVGLLPAILLLVCLGWLLAILSGIAHTHFPDTQHVLELGLQFAFYLTPIVYRIESLGSRAGLSWLVECNPVTSLLALFRTPIMEGTAPAMHHVGVSVLGLVVIGVLAIPLLRKLERNLVFWI